MATLRINTDHLRATQANRSIQDFANDIGVDRSTMSRALSGETRSPGDRLIAGLLLSTPESFGYFFEAIGDDEADAA